MRRRKQDLRKVIQRISPSQGTKVTFITREGLDIGQSSKVWNHLSNEKIPLREYDQEQKRHWPVTSRGPKCRPLELPGRQNLYT